MLYDCGPTSAPSWGWRMTCSPTESGVMNVGCQRPTWVSRPGYGATGIDPVSHWARVMPPRSVEVDRS